MENIRRSVYIETTIPSYAVAKASRDLITAHRQAITRLFWENERQNYDLFTSQFVIDECSRGDKEAAKRRIELIKDLTLIPENEAIADLAETYFNFLEIPKRSKTDCFHLAVCVDAKIHYLLSWNCTHIGMVSYAKVYEYNKRHNLWTPEFLTPEMLMEFEREKDNEQPR
jgi:hypothetical protein